MLIFFEISEELAGGRVFDVVDFVFGNVDPGKLKFFF